MSSPTTAVSRVTCSALSSCPASAKAWARALPRTASEMRNASGPIVRARSMAVDAMVAAVSGLPCALKPCANARAA